MSKSYIYAVSRSTKKEAEKIAKQIESFGMAKTKIVMRTTGKTITYDIMAKPTLRGEIMYGTVNSPRFKSYIGVVRHEPD